MASFIATLLKVPYRSNPEYACIVIDATNKGLATTIAKKALATERLSQEERDWDFWQNTGWVSYRDPELWGKEIRIVVDVVPEEDHVKRSGKGNRQGSENQSERFARYRKAAG